MTIFARLFLAAFCCFFVGPGCTQHTDFFTQESIEGGIELVDTPFFAQEELQCGPAALATLLGAAGVDIHPDTLQPELFLPERQGTLQVELMAAVRRHGRIPSRIAPQLNALSAELHAGRPVLVLQSLGLWWNPAYHYAVVVGILPGEKIVLRSGRSKRLVMEASRFRKTWQRAGHWGMIALKPGEFPGGVDPEQYIQEVSLLERLGMWSEAEMGYRAVLKRFPDHPVALFGLANALLTKNKPAEAVFLYSKIVSQEPDRGVVYNNLAEGIFRMGCRKEALQVIETGLSLMNQPPATMSVLRRTRLEMLSTDMQAEDNGTCAAYDLPDQLIHFKNRQKE